MNTLQYNTAMLLTIRDAAIEANVHVQTIKYHVYTTGLITVKGKVGNTCLIDEKSFRQWMRLRVPVQRRKTQETHDQDSPSKKPS